MSSPILWIGFAAAFLLAGALNLERAFRGRQSARPVRITLAISCIAWAVAGPAYRYLGTGIAYTAAGIGAAIIVVAAVLAIRTQA